MKPSGENLKRFFEGQSLRFNRCLEPAAKCTSKAIRAHSIQNSRVMDLVADNGHVIAPRIKYGKDGPKIIMQSVGRNAASTFTGLCDKHDAALFRALDTKPFDPNDLEQLFLLAYRSVTRELHAVMEGAVRIQTAYQDAVKRGAEDPDVMSPMCIEATGHLMKSYETDQYRADFFDIPFLKNDYQSIQHDVIRLKDQSPNLAVSSLFSFAHVMRGDDLVRCVLNIFPISVSETIVAFSYGKDDLALARAALDRVLRANGAYQKYEISKLIIERIENFIISPRHFSSWDEKKIGKIINAFSATIMSDEAVEDDVELMLF
jgi:hypothetical protein